MAETATYEVVVVPPLQIPAEPGAKILAYAEKTRTIRLRGLQVAPEAFASRYEDELKRGMDFTLTRLRNTAVTTFLAVKKAPSTAQSSNEEDVIAGLLNDEWLGNVVLLGPQEDDGSNPRDFPQGTFPAVGADGNIVQPKGMWFRVGGTFVDPAGRGLGLGLALMNAVVKKAEAEAAKYNVGVRVDLFVYGPNVAARRLYEKAGFKTIEVRESKTRPGTDVVVMEHRLAAEP